MRGQTLKPGAVRRSKQGSRYTALPIGVVPSLSLHIAVPRLAESGSIPRVSDIIDCNQWQSECNPLGEKSLQRSGTKINLELMRQATTAQEVFDFHANPRAGA